MESGDIVCLIQRSFSSYYLSLILQNVDIIIITTPDIG